MVSDWDGRERLTPFPGNEGRLSMVHKAEPGIGGSMAGSPRPSHLCEVCGSHRLAGGPLLSRLDAASTMMWVCADCQHKLSRRVDDEGTLGG